MCTWRLVCHRGAQLIKLSYHNHNSCQGKPSKNCSGEKKCPTKGGSGKKETFNKWGDWNEVLNACFLIGPRQSPQHMCIIWLGCCMRAFSMYRVSSNLPSLIARPGLMWCAIGLRFWYVGDTDPASKLSKGIGHLWSWAWFMAAQLWAINFAKKCELHKYSANNNDSICCLKCSFKLIWPQLVSCYLFMTQLRPLRQAVIT